MFSKIIAKNSALKEFRYNFAKLNSGYIMKKILLSLLTLSSLTFAFDMGGAMNAVNTDKAMASVNKDKASAAASKGTNVTMKDVSDSVDTDKAMDSVDKEKMMKSLY